MGEGGHREHRPVLVKQTVEILQPKIGQTFLDLTVGYGGHAQTLLPLIGSEGMVIGVDQDRTALNAATQRLAASPGRFVPIHSNFAQIDDILAEVGVDAVDGILIDLGISSPQLDNPARGFGFTEDGPLDMRMDADADSPTAADLVNRLGEQDLADLIYQFGEERYSRRIARRILRERENRPIQTTAHLAQLIQQAYPKRRFRIHPATRTFQALRIEVNHEQAVLQTILEQAPKRLAPGGRMAVISFHSLEDRQVKHRFRALAAEGPYRVLTKKPVIAEPDETQSNPRARSAKLRGLEADGES